MRPPTTLNDRDQPLAEFSDQEVSGLAGGTHGERVRNRRIELGLSQEAAAVRCGIHWTQLGKVERGQRSLRLETLVRIADGLDIDAGLLVSGLPSPS